MRLTIAGIDLEGSYDDAWELKSRGWKLYNFTVIGPDGVTRDDLDAIKCELLYGKPIRGVDSCAVESQCRKKISIAIDA